TPSSVRSVPHTRHALPPALPGTRRHLRSDPLDRRRRKRGKLMPELPHLLTNGQTGVVRGFAVPIVADLFFRIPHEQEFVDALPSRDGIAPGLGIQPTKFYSEDYRIRASTEEEPGVPFKGFAHIAFTYTGLKALGVHARTLASFPESFRE